MKMPPGILSAAASNSVSLYSPAPSPQPRVVLRVNVATSVSGREQWTPVNERERESRLKHVSPSLRSTTWLEQDFGGNIRAIALKDKRWNEPDKRLIIYVFHLRKQQSHFMRVCWRWVHGIWCCIRIWFLAMPFNDYMTLTQLFIFFLPQCTHMSNGNKISCFTGLSCGSNKMIKYLFIGS